MADQLPAYADMPLPVAGELWHYEGRSREVMEVDEERGRVRWKSFKKSARWCKLLSWQRWQKYAVRGPLPEAPKELEQADPLELYDLGFADSRLWGITAPAGEKRPWHIPVFRNGWKQAVAQCRARGLNSPAIAKATGLPYHMVAAFTREIKEVYEQLGPGVYAERRERLWFEAVSLEHKLMKHLDAAVPGTTCVAKVAALGKAIIASQQHRAELCGAREAPSAQVNVNVTAGAVVDPVALAVQRFGLDPAALAELGDGLAGQLTDQARDVMDAEFEEVG